VWGAHITVESPRFGFMAKQINAGKLGRLAAAHAHYGHEGPGWSAFFYEQGGGSLPDLAVYNLTSLTGLLATGKEMLVTPEQALHVIEIITAARESSKSGKRIELKSTFKWPVVV
jgi:predicted dehydrogenase